MNEEVAYEDGEEARADEEDEEGEEEEEDDKEVRRKAPWMRRAPR
jgi:hypothetical protein